MSVDRRAFLASLVAAGVVPATELEALLQAPEATEPCLGQMSAKDRFNTAYFDLTMAVGVLTEVASRHSVFNWQIRVAALGARYHLPDLADVLEGVADGKRADRPAEYWLGRAETYLQDHALKAGLKYTRPQLPGGLPGTARSE